MEAGHKKKIRLIQQFVNESKSLIEKANGDQEKAAIGKVLELHGEIVNEEEKEFPDFHRIAVWRDDALLIIRNLQVYATIDKDRNNS